jgi:hypothetical protein
MPRAIIGSVAITTVIYAFVLLVTTGILPYTKIAKIAAPLVEASRVFSGSLGVIIITFAALLATASSANASILASSRISFALGRDKVLPESLNEIHPKFLTPYRPILLTGVLTLILIVSANVEVLSSSASVLMLLNYSLINLTVIVMRLAPPDGYEPAYKSPGYPYLHIIGAITSLAVIFVAGIVAQLIAAGLILASFIWFFVWAKSRSKVKGAMRNLEWSQVFSFKPVSKKKPKFKESTISNSDLSLDEDLAPIEKQIYRVLVPMSNPDHQIAMLKVSSELIKNSQMEGEVNILNVLEVPDQTPLDLVDHKEKLLPKRRELQQQMLNIAVDFGKKEEVIINPKIIYSHSKFSSIYNMIQQENINFLLLRRLAVLYPKKVN